MATAAATGNHDVLQPEAVDAKYDRGDDGVGPGALLQEGFSTRRAVVVVPGSARFRSHRTGAPHAIPATECSPSGAGTREPGAGPWWRPRSIDSAGRRRGDPRPLGRATPGVCAAPIVVAWNGGPL